MKKIILFTLAVGMIAGCTKSNEKQNKCTELADRAAYALDAFNLEGHKYITYINGGIVHAESCNCKNPIHGGGAR